MKYWILGLSLLLAACSSTVDMENQAEYKCGEQIVKAELLDDNSMILRINGVNNVLTKVISAAGDKYENLATRVSFTEQDGEYYLAIQGRSYPMCKRIEK